MSKILKFLFVLGLPALTGCGLFEVASGTGVGNPPQADVALSLKANTGAGLAKRSAAVVRNPDGSLTVRDSLGQALTLANIDVLIRKVEFVLPQGVTCSSVRGVACIDTSAWINGPYDVDLMTGAFTPSTNFIKLPAGVYKELKSGLGVPPGTGAFAGLDTTRPDVIVTGRFGESSDTGRAFKISLHVSDELEFGDSIGVPIHSGALNKLVLTLSVDNWFHGLDMNACLDATTSAANTTTSGVAGTLQWLDDSWCGGSGSIFRKNLTASGDFENQEEPE